MPKRIAPLTDTKVRTIKPAEKPQKLFDGGGLFLLVTPTGGKLWRLKYRFGGTEKLLSLGIYPQTSLAEARQKRDQATALLANGVDPNDTKKAQKASGNQETGIPNFPLLGRSVTPRQSSEGLSFSFSLGLAPRRSNPSLHLNC